MSSTVMERLTVRATLASVGAWLPLESVLLSSESCRAEPGSALPPADCSEAAVVDCVCGARSLLVRSPPLHPARATPPAASSAAHLMCVLVMVLTPCSAPGPSRRRRRV